MLFHCSYLFYLQQILKYIDKIIKFFSTVSLSIKHFQIILVYRQAYMNLNYLHNENHDPC